MLPEMFEGDDLTKSSLRLSYSLALEALSATHVVTAEVQKKLANVVLTAFLDRFLAGASLDDDDILAIAEAGLERFFALSGAAMMKQ